MKKYLVSLLLSLKRERAYIVGFGASLLRFPVMVIVVTSMWAAVFGQSRTPAGALQTIVVYYVLVSFLRICEMDFAYSLPYQISRDIASGSIALLLVRPIHYPSYAISLAAGRISLHLLLGIPLVIVLVTVFEGAPGILRLSSFLVSSVVGLLVSAQIGLILGLLSFWTGKIFGIRDVIYSSSFLLSGALLPLQYLPHWLRQVTLFLPFRQIYDAPIQVFMGTSPAGVIGQQLAWLAALLAGSHLIWVRGMRLFECQGG